MNNDLQQLLDLATVSVDPPDDAQVSIKKCGDMTVVTATFSDRGIIKHQIQWTGSEAEWRVAVKITLDNLEDGVTDTDLDEEN